LNYDHLNDLDTQVQQAVEVVAGRIIHVDGDILAYNCAGNDETPASVAKSNLLQRVANLKTLSGSDQIVVHLTSPLSNKGKRFEIAVTQPYQEQRTHSARPKNWAFLREVLDGYANAGHPEYCTWLDREADDGMSAKGWEASRMGTSNLCVIASHDKDLRQVPGLYLDWVSGVLKERKHTYDEPVEGVDNKDLFHGVWFLLYQMIAGDAVDKIPGIVKVSGHWLKDHAPWKVSKKVREGKEDPIAKAAGDAMAGDCLRTVEPNAPSIGYDVVKEIYEQSFGRGWEVYFKEQWQLLCLYYYDNDMRLQLARDIRDGKFDTRNP